MLPGLFEALERLTPFSDLEPIAGMPAPEHVADALWLASQLRLARPNAAVSESVDEVDEDDEQTEHRPGSEDVGADPFARPTGEKQVPLVAERDERATHDVPALRTPAATALPHALALSRALRPLRRRIPSRHQFTLDEGATAEYTAIEGHWHPVLRPLAERWLDLAIVVDDGPSMQVWRATTSSLCRLLERQGFARDVRSWRLDTSSPSHVRLYARHGGSRQVDEVSDASGRRLVVIVSDCVSPGWWGAMMADLVQRWARHQPVSLIQVLPQRLWGQTALGSATATQIRAPRAASPNRVFSPLVRKRPRLVRRHRGTASSRPFVSVTTLEPEFVSAWSRFLAAPAGGFGVAIGLGGLRMEKPSAEIVEPSKEVERFQARASPVAFQLACLLAAAPLKLPIIRLVQQSLLPDSSQAHLAEFLLSGLLQRLDSPRRNLEDELLHFKPGVRDALLDEGTFASQVDVQRRISAFIAPRFGQALDFNAYLANPDALDAANVNADARPFATVSAAVLQRLGGKYRDAAERFIRGEARVGDVADLVGETPLASQSLSDSPPDEALPGSSTSSPLSSAIRRLGEIYRDATGRIRGERKTRPGAAQSESGIDDSPARTERQSRRNRRRASALPAVVEIARGTRWSRIAAARFSSDPFYGAPGTSRFSDRDGDSGTPRWRPIYLADSFASCARDFSASGVLDFSNLSRIPDYVWIAAETTRPLRVADLRESGDASQARDVDVIEACFTSPDQLDGVLYRSHVAQGDFLALFNVRARDALRVVHQQHLSELTESLRALDTEGVAPSSPERQVALIIGSENARKESHADFLVLQDIFQHLGFESAIRIVSDAGGLRRQLRQMPRAESFVLYWATPFIFDNGTWAFVMSESANSPTAETISLADMLRLTSQLPVNQMLLIFDVSVATPVDIPFDLPVEGFREAFLEESQVQGAKCVVAFSRSHTARSELAPPRQSLAAIIAEHLRATVLMGQSLSARELFAEVNDRTIETRPRRQRITVQVHLARPGDDFVFRSSTGQALQGRLPA